MRFVRTAVIAAHAVGHLLGAEQACRLDNRALALHPLGFNRVEPMRSACSPHALASRIWRWRKMKASAERGPAAIAWRPPRLGPSPFTDPLGPHLVLDLLSVPEQVVIETTDCRGQPTPAGYRDRTGWHPLLNAAGPDLLSGGRWEEAWAMERWTCVREDGEIVQLAHDARRDDWVLEGRWR